MSSQSQSTKSRRLRPDFCFSRIEDITPQWLAQLGVRGILLDIDNTLTRWELLEVPPAAREWLAGMTAAGLDIRLLSNGLAHKRRSVAQQTGIAEVGGPLFKPLAGFYRRGLGQLALSPAEVLMVGDSVFTDIAGANRCGIWTALV
nr:YqeG family HAD IIIA-type phosphatase [bacterium]